MDKVMVTKGKLDSLAQHINEKAGTTGAKTIAQMQATVDGIKVGGELQTKTLRGTGTYTPDEGYDGFSQVEVDIIGLDGITDDKLRFGTGLWNGPTEHEGRYVGTYNYTFKDIITPPPTEAISSGKIVLPPFVPCNLIRKIEESGSISALYDMPFTELRYQATDTDISAFRLFVTYGNNTNLYLIGQWVKKSDGTYKLQQVTDGGFSRTLLFFEPPALASDTTPLAKWLRASVNSNCGWGGYTPDRPLSYLSKEEITITKNGKTTVSPVLRRKHADGKPTTKTIYSDGFESVTVNVNVPVPAVQDTKAVTITSNGTVSITPDAPHDALSSVNVTVDVASGGGGGASAKWDDVTFIDYDGSVLYSYTLEEAQALTELPALPSHEGLICQGWNWTLEAIKALNRPVTVGAMYITDDGATRLHIRIATVGRMTVPLYIGQTVANGISIDWGDGSTAETLSGAGNVNTSHTYAEPGNYVISLMPQDGCTLSFGDGSSSYCVMGSTANNGKVYCNMLQDVSIGKNVTSIGDSAFNFCYSLASITIPIGVTSIGNGAFSYCSPLVSITIPTGVTSIGNYAFSYCYSIASITIPDGVTSIGNSAFDSCKSLASITIPIGVTSIGNGAFNSCSSLASITIPTGVTSIGNYAFSYCYSLASITIPTGVTSIGTSFSNCHGMRYYDFSSCTSIPALSNNDAFFNIPSDCQILIPSALYNNWKTATNWTTYASKMVAV